MNYSGFLRPAWTWLLRDDPDPEQHDQFWGIPVGVRASTARDVVAAMARFRAGVPWEAVAPLVDPARQPRRRRASERSPDTASATWSASGCR